MKWTNQVTNSLQTLQNVVTSRCVVENLDIVRDQLC